MQAIDIQTHIRLSAKQEESWVCEINLAVENQHQTNSIKELTALQYLSVFCSRLCLCIILA